MKNFFNKEKIAFFVGFLKKKKLIVGAVLLVVVLFFIFQNGANKDSSIIEVTFGELKETVKATGQTTSQTELSLSFDKQGRVSSVNAVVGKKVKKGDVLATLESGSENARILEARASLASAKARLSKVVEGATNEEINLSEVLLRNAERDYQNTLMTQDVLVSNAYRKLIGSSLEAISSNSSSARAPLISGNYVLNKEGTIKINVYNSGIGPRFSASGVLSVEGGVNTTNLEPIGDSGLFISFPSTDNLIGTEWLINIPNKKSIEYITNKNAYDSALKTKDSATSSALSLVEQRKAELALKRADARNSDVLLAEADVLAAEARVKDAESNYAKNVLRAPSGGVITKVEIKNGEIAQSQKEAVVIEDIGSLYVEADINESNIAKLKVGQKVDLTFDALSKKDVFSGEVVSINPSSNTEDGVVNYKIKIVLSSVDERIRPGMNAEISVLISTKTDVLSLPEASLVKKEDKTFVNIVLDEVKKTSKEVEVSTGVKGDGNMVEILSGLREGDKIIVSK